MLVVRASHSLTATLKALNAAGHNTLTPCTISTTTPQPLTAGAIAHGQHIILTSAAAIPTAAAFHHNAAHCVGNATAAAARQAGLTLGRIGHNNAQSLADDIVAAFTPPQVFHHLTTQGSHTGWYKTLTAAGHAIQRHTAYTTTVADTLTPQTIKALKQQEPTLLFSARSAEHLIFLAAQATLSLNTITAVCLSPSVAAACQGHFGTIRTARTPTLTAMIDIL